MIPLQRRVAANIVLDLGGAAAAGVRTLIGDVQTRIAHRLARSLEPEIAVPGAF